MMQDTKLYQRLASPGANQGFHFPRSKCNTAEAIPFGIPVVVLKQGETRIHTKHTCISGKVGGWDLTIDDTT